MDHGSESGLKSATKSKQKTKVQGLELLVTLVLGFLDCNKDPRMWKRDLKSAFRNVPLDQEHKWCSWSAWKTGGVIMMARHLAAPFGWVSSCFNFHRLGEFIKQAMIRLVRVPCSRYVDDFLGASVPGLLWPGGKCMDKLMELVGFANDEKKSKDNCRSMVALGHFVTVSFAKRKIETRLEEEKALRWMVDLEEIKSTGICSPALAGKFAGRFPWAVTMQNDKIGRAYIR